MIGYVLALQHPDEIARLDLFCPVARPSFIPRTSVEFIRFLKTIGLSPERIIRIAAHPSLVELVTRYTFHPDWSDEDRHRITQMRLREAQFYSPIMFDLMRQTLQFKKVMKDSYCSVPTNICYTSDDNVAGATDYEWYEDHANVQKIEEITGGHLCVVANPERVVKLFGSEPKEEIA
jgi:pimeloyl-ACP methyl ester carboxylesterase